MARPLVALALSIAVAAALAGCSGSGGQATGTLQVSGAWVRPSSGADTTAAYLTITNGTTQPDALLSVTTPVAGSAAIHETSPDASGMMAMHPVERVEVPAGGTSTLEPGGFHVMLVGLTRELTVGQHVELTLTFERAGVITVTADVRAP